MDNWFKWLLAIYLLLFGTTAFAWRSYLVWRRTGANPYVLGTGDSVYDFVGKLFRLTLVATFAAIFANALVPQAEQWLVPIAWLSHTILAVAGVILLLAALVWVLVAQAQMGAAWSIGIDSQVKTELVQRGLFAVSRNPIFLGMLVMLVGLLLVLPTAVTLAIAGLGVALIHIQVRLEEEHLARTHGLAYTAYSRKVRRWL